MAAVAAFAFVGCENDNMDNIKDNGPAVNGSEVVFTASLDAVVRTTPSSGGAVAWTEDDTIGVWDGTNYVNATIKEVSGASVKFSAVVDPEAESYVAVTPADAWNAAAGDKVVLNFPTTQSAGKQVVSVAAISDPATPAVFKNTSNLLRFTVKKEAVKYAKLEGRNGEKFGATVEVDPATGVGSAATGSATEIIIPITTGENFVALPQGVNLSQGYTITLYGDEAMTDYEGEVYSSGAIALDRNKQRHLGVIDGWIDNWKLWQAGKSITIAGVEYSKASTGVAGELLQTNGADLNIKTYINGKYGNVVLFLEEVGDYKFISEGSFDVGKKDASTNVLLIGRYDNTPATYQPAGWFSVLNSNYIACRSVEFTFAGGATIMFRPFTYDLLGSLLFDNCKIIHTKAGTNFIGPNNNALQLWNEIKIVNSKIESKITGRIEFMKPYTGVDTDDLKTFTFENNFIYNANATGAFDILVQNGTPIKGSSTNFSIANNTFYNMFPNSMIWTYNLASISIKNNIFHSTTPSGSPRIIYSSDKTNSTYIPVLENNIANYNLAYMNPNGYRPVTTNVDKVSGEIFSVANTTTGEFIPVDAYKDKGAQKLF